MPSNSYMVAQITDCHLLAQPGARLHGRCPDESLAGVLASVKTLDPDVVVVTGDLTEAGAPDAYQRLKGLLETLACPVVCLPGNHDDPAVMRRHLLGGGIGMPDTHPLGDWRLFLLDDTLPGRPEGRLGEARLAALEWRLHENRDHHKLVFVHHQPVDTGSPWIDGMGLEDGERLLDRLADDGDVRAVGFGHIHHAFSAERDGIALYGTPSTSFQALPEKERFELDTENGPGFRWFRLFHDGHLATGITRIPPAFADD